MCIHVRMRPPFRETSGHTLGSPTGSAKCAHIAPYGVTYAAYTCDLSITYLRYSENVLLRIIVS